MPVATGQVTGYGDTAPMISISLSCQHFATTISLRSRTNRINVPTGELRVAMQAADFLREEYGLKRGVPSTANTACITITGCITELLF